MKITRNTNTMRMRGMLASRGIETPRGWDIAMRLLLLECDHIEVEGFGHDSVFLLCDSSGNRIGEG